jgi:hypothetical protein
LRHRAIVIAPWQFALHLDQTEGLYAGAGSVCSAFDSMCDDPGWAKEGENGTNLSCRSIAQL